MSLDWLGTRMHLALLGVNSWLTEPLFTVGETEFSAAGIAKLLVYFALLIWVARLLRRALVRRVFPQARLDIGTSEAVASMIFYSVLTLGTLVGLQASGVDLSTLTVLLGAVGVGIGFGLQTIAANFVSGLIILFEQPIRVGDRIQIGDLDGRVVHVRGRATEIVTNDEIAVIVPNSEFISQRVINWSHGEDRIRIGVPVGVAYGSDVESVRDVLLEAALSVPAVLREPPPKVWLRGFGDSAIEFEILGWTRELLQTRGEFISQVNFAVHAALKRHAITIPFPQRDLHLKSAVPLPISVERGRRGTGAAPAGAPAYGETS